MKTYGLRKLSDNEKAALTLHKLSKILEKLRSRVLITRKGLSVVPSVFDLYQGTLIAPDHLFFNLVKNVININFRKIERHQRRYVDALVQEVLYENGMELVPRFYNDEKIETHSLSTSQTIAVYMIAPWAFSIGKRFNKDGTIREQQKSSTTSQELLYRLQHLISNTHFVRIAEIDGLEKAKRLQKYEGRLKIETLKPLAEEYMKLVEDVCANDEIAYAELDKPNVHRLIELYHHLTASFGHVRNFMELLFEPNHHPFKKLKSQSNRKDGFLHKMNGMLSNEWLSRLSGVLSEKSMCHDKEISKRIFSELLGSGYSHDFFLEHMAFSV